MKKLPKGRTLAEFQPLMPAEDKLLFACAEGIAANLSQNLPSKKTDDNTIRASFIRFLALGGDDEAPVHENGIFLAGAWIEGILDFNGTVTASSVSLNRTHFEKTPILEGAKIEGRLSFSGSLLPGLRADRVLIKGSVFLSNGFTAKGKVRLLGAQIDGNLACKGANLDVKEGVALSADGAAIKGNVFLSNGFTAKGEVRLLGVQIGGDLACMGANLDIKEGNALSADGAVIKGSVFLSDRFTTKGKVRLVGAKIDGSLSCKGANLDVTKNDALSADRAVIKGSVFLSEGFTTTGIVKLLGSQIGGNFSCDGAQLNGKMGATLLADGMTVNGAFFLRKLKEPVHGIRLSSAKVGRLIDDEAAWGESLVLDGFVYEHLAGGAPTSAKMRLAWLKKQTIKHKNQEDFRPQPWKQLQTVLRNMGHTEDARQIAIAFEDHLYAENLIGQTPANWSKWRKIPYRHFLRKTHWLFKTLIGYGYRPLRLVMWMLGVWLLCAFIYWSAALHGMMAPSQPLVFQNKQEYSSCMGNWYLCEALPEAYTGFSPLAYSLDLLLPLVNLQQEQDWAPLIPTPKNTWHEEILGNWSFKHLARLTVWFEILFGWVASLLLVAVVSGLTKRSEDQ